MFLLAICMILTVTSRKITAFGHFGHFTQQRFFGLLPGVRHASVQASGSHRTIRIYRPNKFPTKRV
jgi:hypothetical protein